MFQYLKIIGRSALMAIQELIDNPLRSFLSLLGITIGIFCIISILTGVDFLNTSIDDSIKELGQDVVYVQKFPWSFDEEEYPWWEYIKRPSISYENFQRIERDLDVAESVFFFIYFGGTSLKFKSELIKRADIIGASPGMEQVMNVKLQYGRFFNELENRGANVAVIGEEIRDELFGKDVNPVGETIKLKGRKVKVIGLIREEDNLLDFIQWRDAVIIPYEYGDSFFSFSKKNADSWIGVKAKEGITVDQLREELRGSLRSIRSLRPIQEDNFAVNKVTSFLEAVSQTKEVLRIAGYLLGIFSLLIGGFGIANIMFVSVKERTKYIGIKKAIGAPKWVILTEFLIEAIILCVIGCLIGLFLVYLLSAAASSLANLNFTLTPENISLGLGMSVIIGIVSGIIPAIMASNMNAVDAIRS